MAVRAGAHTGALDQTFRYRRPLCGQPIKIRRCGKRIAVAAKVLPQVLAGQPKDVGPGFLAPGSGPATRLSTAKLSPRQSIGAIHLGREFMGGLL